jgi:phosphate starvation-inducible PhoH-like protein
LPSSSREESAAKIRTEKFQVVGVPMVSLFGAEDKLLKTLEQTYPAVEVHARGNEVVLNGPSAQVSEAKTH